MAATFIGNRLDRVYGSSYLLRMLSENAHLPFEGLTALDSGFRRNDQRREFGIS